MKASVIIVHYNTPDLTRACVQSVLRHTKGVGYEVVVVDNASTVGDIRDLSSLENVILIKAEANLGFAKGNNLGINHSSGECLILLNSDAELVDDMVSKACQKLAQNPDWGVLSGRLTYADGRPQYPTGRFASVWLELAELFRYPKWAPRFDRASHYLGDTFAGQEEREVDWVWGALFCLKRDTLHQLPGQKLAEDFFMYYEDVQWCRQIRDLGYKIIYSPEIKAIHHLSGSAAPGTSNELAKYINRTFPNEKKFLEQRYGQGYAIKYYALKMLHLFTQRNESANILRKEYWDNLIKDVSS